MKSLGRLFRYLKPYWKSATIAPFLMALEVAMDLLQPYMLTRIVDQGIGGKDMQIVITTGLMMVGFAIIGAFGGTANGYFATRASISAATDLRKDLFKKVQSFSFLNLDEFKTGHLITRLTNDVTQVQELMITILRIVVRAPLLFVGSIIFAYITSPRLTLILVIMLPVLGAALFYITKKAPAMFKIVQEKLDDLNEVMQENLSGIRVVKAFNRAKYEEKRFSERNTNLMDTTINAMKMLAKIHPIFMITINIGVAAAVYFGGIHVIDGDLTLGQMIAFYNYLVRAMMSLIFITMILTRVIRSSASASRIEEVLHTEPAVQNSPDMENHFVNSGTVQFKNVSFQYNDHTDPVLQNISFEAAPGETVAILGQTGSGKSSLIHLIPRFYEVSEGEVLIDGRNVRDVDMKSLRSTIGVALQESILFTGSIRENIRYGKPEATEEEVITAAKAAQAHDFILEMPEGYDTEIGQRGVNLSGGQKQRIAIARALLIKPSVLILDDSTSAVDVETETKIQNALEELMAETTSFVIAQRISTVLNADKIIVLHDGQITAQGDHHSLMKTSPIYQEIFESQLGKGNVDYGTAA
jgi:ATP-binding cassette subfamily B multidrug efflux pump